MSVVARQLQGFHMPHLITQSGQQPVSDVICNQGDSKTISLVHVRRHQTLWFTSVRMRRGWPLTLWFTPVRMRRVAHLRRSCRVSLRFTTPHRHEWSQRTNQMRHATVSRRVNLVQSYGNNTVNMIEHMYGRGCPQNLSRPF